MSKQLGWVLFALSCVALVALFTTDKADAVEASAEPAEVAFEDDSELRRPDSIAKPKQDSARSVVESTVQPEVPETTRNVGDEESENPEVIESGRALELVGRLFDSDGRLLIAPNLSVSVQPVSGDSITGTVAEGHFRVEGLRAGVQQVRAQCEGYRDIELPVDIFEEFTNDVDIIMRRIGVISVFVLTPDGEHPFEFGFSNQYPLHGLAGFSNKGLAKGNLGIAVTRSLPVDEVLADFSLMADRYGAGKLVRDPSDLKSEAGYVKSFETEELGGVYVSLMFEQVVVASEFVPYGEETVTFILSEEEAASHTNTLQYRLIDALTGEPLAPLTESLSGGRMSSMGLGNTISEGLIKYECLSAGTYDITAHVPGYEDFSRRVIMEPGADLDLGNIELHPKAKLKCVVVDEYGVAVADATIRIAELIDSSVLETHNVHLVSADEFGDYYVRLGAGLHRISASGDEDGESYISVVNGSNPPLELRLKLLPDFRVTFRDPQYRHAGMTLRIIDPNEVLIDAHTLPDDFSHSQWLPIGTYRIEVHSDSGLLLTKSLELTEAHIELKLDD